MKTILRRAALAALLAGTASATAIVMSVPAEAARAPAGPTIDRKILEPLVEAQKAFNAMDYATAVTKGMEADAAVAEKSPHETYQVSKILALAHLQQQKLPEAMPYFDRAIASGAMPAEENAFMYRMAMLLNYNAKDYAKAVQYGSQAAAAAPLDDQGNLVLTQSYYFANDFAGAERFAQQIIAAKTSAGEKPDRALLDTLYNAQLKQNKTAEMTDTLGQIVLAEPTPENWTRLIDQAFRGSPTEGQIVNIYRLKMRTNAMTAQDYRAMATASAQLGLGTEAKATLEKGLAANLVNQAEVRDLLMQSTNIAAKEAASIAEFEKLAAASPNGETDIKLGETLLTLGRKAEAEAAIRRGIQKGGLKDAPNAQLLLAIVLLDNGKKDEAVQILDQLRQNPAIATAAMAWKTYAQSAA